MEKRNYNSLEAILRHLSFIIKMEGRKALNSYPEISKTMFEVIQIIYFSKKIKGTTLSEILEISKPAASELLKKLVVFGFVEKKVNLKDKREIIYTLTNKGNNVIKEVIKKRVQFLKKVVNKDKLETLLPYLEEIIKNIKTIEKQNKKS